MRLREIDIRKAPALQRPSSVNDLHDIRFDENGLALVEVPFELLDSLPLVGAQRGPGPRLAALVSLIRRRGFAPDAPIVCRIGMKGRWVVQDGGHRITAARIVNRDWLGRLLGRRVERMQFLLYTTPESWSKLTPPQVRDRWGDPAV